MLGLLGLVAVLVLTIAVVLRQFFTPVIIALLLAYIVDPLLRWLERHHIRRWMATTILYIVCLVGIALACIILGPRIGNQTGRLYHGVSGLARDYSSTMLNAEWIVEPVANTLIMSAQIKMHTVTIILALLIGGSLFGMFGVILSVPLAAVVKILWEEFVLPPLREMAGYETAGQNGST